MSSLDREGAISENKPASGPVAQWLEPAAHNGLVGGSSPPGPTSLRSLRELRPSLAARATARQAPQGGCAASEGCRAEARRAKAGLLPRATARQARRTAREATKADAPKGEGGLCLGGAHDLRLHPTKHHVP